jgi:acyl-CoA synthetase (AMP-forming)/AMP-acid ligase II
MLVHDYLKFHAREQPDAVCMILDQRELSYGQVQAKSRQLANALIEAGLEQGDRFGVLARNSMETVIAYLAGSNAGLVPVPLNWRLAPPEWQYILNDANVKLLIAEEEFCAGIESVRSRLPGILEYLSAGTPVPPGWQALEDFCLGHSEEDPDIQIDEQDVFYQMYTSGTTGKPKGAMLTHYSVTSNAMQTMPYLGQVMGPGKKALLVMPMFHAGAASFVIGSIASGTTMVIHREFTPDRLADALSHGHINVANLVPAMIQAMLVHVPDLGGRDYSKLEVIIYGASSISEETLRRAMEIFSCDFYQGFGQTESSACITFLSAQDHRRALENKPELLRSAGRALIGTSVRIVDSEDRELPRGEAGEIIMRGPQMMKSYWNMPQASAETLKHGWLHTGDVGVMDDEGYVYVQDRIKDMIVTGGENVYPREVENVLFGHPSIADVAVIGLPDEEYGEAVTAVVVLRQGVALDTDEMIVFCRGKLGGFKIPRQIRIVNELPRNPSGKVLKKDLREECSD